MKSRDAAVLVLKIVYGMLFFVCCLYLLMLQVAHNGPFSCIALLVVALVQKAMIAKGMFRMDPKSSNLLIHSGQLGIGMLANSGHPAESALTCMTFLLTST